MKRVFLLAALVCFAFSVSFAQNKKAEKEAAAKAQFDKAVAAIDAKDFVIIVDTYVSNKTGEIVTTIDNTNFFSYEKEFAYVQGVVFFGESYPNTHKLTVSNYNQVVDKKGNLKVEMFGRGSMTEGKIEIYLKKGGNYADVIYTMKNFTVRFSGEVIPTAESKYFKRPGAV
jgi:hypothetical protein